MEVLLPYVWAMMIGFSIIMYVILDGFTLGTGMLLPFLNKGERDLAMSVILPTWDGNQTWLVLGGATLYGAFPLAFSALLPVLYLPIILMVLAFLFRGVVFEFRLKDKTHVKYWDVTFMLASLFITFIQGTILGNLVEGFQFSTHPYLVSDRAFISPFTLFTAVSLVFGYALLGTTRLIYKTDGTLQAKMYQIIPYCTAAIIIAMIVVSVWSPLLNEHIYNRWFGHQHWSLLGILPYLAVITFIVFAYAIKKRQENLPFWCVVTLFLYPYIGFLISVYPYIVPYKMTLLEAAAPTNSLYFMLFGALIMLPVLLVYTGYSYQVFQGKVKNVFHY